MNVSIKLPNNLRGKILSFPFIHAFVKEAKKRLNEDEEELLNLHLISNSEDIDALNLLPFNAYYHEIEDADLKTVFTIHRACVQLKIPHTDIFISTTESFVDATIGKNLKAQEKIGFQLGKNSFFLNKKIALPSGEHQSAQIFSLIKGFVEDELPSIPRVCSREVKPLYADWNMNPYFIINLSLRGRDIHPEWVELINLFEHQNIVLMSDGISLEDQEDSLNDYIKTLSTKNSYQVITTESNIDFAKAVSFSWCFISEDSPLVHLAAYCGAEVFHLNRKENTTLYGTQHFIGESEVFSLKNAEYKSGSDFNFSKIFDIIIKYIELKNKDRAE
tara:strand:+ start:607 stop:1602 length:996 start_codon:yes stop_codon:yes gene_type:complete